MIKILKIQLLKIVYLLKGGLYRENSIKGIEQYEEVIFMIEKKLYNEE